MLIENFEKIFLANGYCKLDIEQKWPAYTAILFEPEQKINKEEYFVVVEAAHSSVEALEYIFTEGADLLFNDFKSMEQLKRSFAKNCTMIICCESLKENSKAISNMALKIEEDHYNFKKNIVLYTKGELTGLNIFLEGQGPDFRLTAESINTIINANSGRDFLAFKEKEKNFNNHYSLFLKLMMKLPFLCYSPEVKDLVDLEKNVEEALTANQQVVFRRMLSISLSEKDEDIEKMILEVWGENG